METEQQEGLVSGLRQAYIFMVNVSDEFAIELTSDVYKVWIDPLLKGISLEDRLKLADLFRDTILIGQRREYNMGGLADYLDPSVGGL